MKYEKNSKRIKKAIAVLLSLSMATASGLQLAYASAIPDHLIRLADNTSDIGVRSEGYDVEDFEKTYDDLSVNIWIPDNKLETGGTVFVATKVYNSEKYWDGKSPFRITGYGADEGKAKVHFNNEDMVLEDSNLINVDGTMINPAAVKFDNLKMEHPNLKKTVNFFARGAKLVMGENLELEDGASVQKRDDGYYEFTSGDVKWNIYGGSEHNSSTTKAKTNVVVEGGIWDDIYGGGGNKSGTFTGTHVTVIDGAVKKICGGGEDNSDTGDINDSKSGTIIDISGGIVDSVIGGSEIDSEEHVKVNNDIVINVSGGHVNSINAGNEYYTPLRRLDSQVDVEKNMSIINTGAVLGSATVNISGSGNVKNVIGDELRNSYFGSYGENNIGGYRRIKGPVELNVSAANSFDELDYFDTLNVSGKNVILTSDDILGDGYIGRIKVTDGAALYLKHGGIINVPYDADHEDSNDITLTSFVADSKPYVLSHGWQGEEEERQNESVLKIDGKDLITSSDSSAFNDDSDKCGLRIYGSVSGYSILDPGTDPLYSENDDYYYYVVSDSAGTPEESFKSPENAPYVVLSRKLKDENGKNMIGWYLKETQTPLTRHERVEPEYGKHGNIEYYTDAEDNCWLYNPAEDEFEETEYEKVILHYPGEPVVENVLYSKSLNLYSFDLYTYCSVEGCNYVINIEDVKLTLHPETKENEEYFTDQNGNIYIYDEQSEGYTRTDIIPYITEPQYIYVPQQDPDVNNEGIKEHYTDDSGNIYVLIENEYILIDDSNKDLLIIPKTETTFVPEKPAKVNEAGIKAHYEDGQGNKYILESGKFEKVSDKDLVIPAIIPDYVPRVEPTVNSSGMKEHFIDGEGKFYILVKDTYVSVSEEDLILEKVKVEYAAGKEATVNETGIKPHYIDAQQNLYIYDGQQYVKVTYEDLVTSKKQVEFKEMSPSTVNYYGVKAHYEDEDGNKYIRKNGKYESVSDEELRIDKVKVTFISGTLPDVNHDGVKEHYTDINGKLYIYDQGLYWPVNEEMLRIPKMSVQEVSGYEPDVNRPGLRTHYVDGEGNKYLYKNGIYEAATDSQLTIPKLVAYEVEEVSPTVNHSGVRLHYIDKYGTAYILSGDKYIQVTPAQLVIPQIPVHFVSEIPAKVNEDGIKAHYEDDDGNKYILTDGKYVSVSDRALKLHVEPVYYPNKAADSQKDGFKAHYEYDGLKYIRNASGKYELIEDESGYINHYASQPVKENMANADCINSGSYDMVTYCAHCGAELSVSSYTIPPLNHKWREDYTVNEISPGCDREGSYDMVRTCTECGITETIHMIIPPTGHTDDKNTGFCDTCGKFIPGTGGAVVLGKGGNDMFYVSVDKSNWKLISGNNQFACPGGIVYIKPLDTQPAKYKITSNAINSHTDADGITMLRIDGTVVVTAVPAAVPDVKESLNIFERIVEFIREIIERIKGIFS